MAKRRHIASDPGEFNDLRNNAESSIRHRQKRPRVEDGEERVVNTTRTMEVDTNAKFAEFDQRLGSIEALLRQLVQRETTAGPMEYEDRPRNLKKRPLKRDTVSLRQEQPVASTSLSPGPFGPAPAIIAISDDDENDFSYPNDDRRSATRQVLHSESKPKRINVTVSAPDGSQSKRSLVVNRRRNLFDLDGLGLESAMVVGGQHNKGFTRSTIKQAFSGHHCWSYHHWEGADNRKHNHVPFLTMPLSRHFHLPTRPGAHGLILQDLRVFNDQTPVDREIPLFVGIGKNDWRLMGMYNIVRWCEIESSHVRHLPPRMLDTWAQSYGLESSGGDWIDSANEILKRTRPRKRSIERSPDGIKEALLDGRMSLTVTILECVGYPYAWFDDLLRAKKAESLAMVKTEDDEVTLVGSPMKNRMY